MLKNATEIMGQFNFNNGEIFDILDRVSFIRNIQSSCSSSLMKAMYGMLSISFSRLCNARLCTFFIMSRSNN